MNFPASNMYLESTTNKTFPYTNQTEGGFDIDGDGVVDTPGKDKSAGFTNSIPFLGALLSVGLGILL